MISILLASSAVSAEPIYKSIDRYGNVSYSLEPAMDAVRVKTVELPPTPSEDEIDRGRQRFQALEERDAQREIDRQRQEEADLQRLQILSNLELRRELANREPQYSPIVYQSPYYWYGTGFFSTQPLNSRSHGAGQSRGHHNHALRPTRPHESLDDSHHSHLSR